MKGLIPVGAVMVLLAGVGSARAHHSYSMFDLSRDASVQGTVTALEWTNPHVWLWVTEGAAGGSKTYGFETVSPGELTRFFGWQRASIAVGEKVRVTYAPLRSGKGGGAIKSLVRADGRVFTPFKAPPGLPVTYEPVNGPKPAP